MGVIVTVVLLFALTGVSGHHYESTDVDSGTSDWSFSGMFKDFGKWTRQTTSHYFQKHGTQKYPLAAVLFGNLLSIAAFIWIITLIIPPLRTLTEGEHRQFFLLLLFGLSAVATYVLHTNYEGSFFWQIPMFVDIWHKKVMINIAAVIAASILLIFYSFDPKDTMTQGLIWLVVIAVATALALEPFTSNPALSGSGYNENDYKYVWEGELGARFVLFLVGDSACSHDGKTYCYTDESIKFWTKETAAPPDYAAHGGPFSYGILRGTQAVSTLLYFFLFVLLFTQIAPLEGEGLMKGLPFVISFILAGAISNHGLSNRFGVPTLSVNSLALFAFIVFFILVGKAWYAKSTGAWTGAGAWILALLLVGYLTHLVAPGLGFEGDITQTIATLTGSSSTPQQAQPPTPTATTPGTPQPPTTPSPTQTTPDPNLDVHLMQVDDLISEVQKKRDTLKDPGQADKFIASLRKFREKVIQTPPEKRDIIGRKIAEAIAASKKLQ